jgi:hypothetical protein
LVGWFFGGLVAGEGSFMITTQRGPFADGAPRLRFVFTMTLADWDRALLESLRGYLGVGSIQVAAPRKEGWQPTVTFRVQSRRAHRRVVIPFASQFLPPSVKREQFELWRKAFVAYELAHPSRWGQGPSMCSEPGCEKPVRGRGLCRQHYYRVTGY